MDKFIDSTWLIHMIRNPRDPIDMYKVVLLVVNEMQAIITVVSSTKRYALTFIYIFMLVVIVK